MVKKDELLKKVMDLVKAEGFDKEIDMKKANTFVDDLLSLNPTQEQPI